MISVMQHEEVDVKNPVMETFAWDVLNGTGKYEGDNAIDLAGLFAETKGPVCPGAPAPTIKFDYWLQGGSTPFPPCDENTWVIVKYGTLGVAKY